MNTKRLLIALAWIASMAVTYVIGSSNSGKTNPAASSTSGAGKNTVADSATSGDPAKRPIVTAVEGGDPGASGEPVDVRTVIARARSEMGGGMGMFMDPRAMLRALSPLVNIPDSQIQEALAEVEAKVTEPQQKMMFYSLLLSRWAETDGAAAMDYATQKIKSQGPFGSQAGMSVLGSWSRRDPAGAWKWFQQERERGETTPMGGAERYLPILFSGMASSNPDLAFSHLESLPQNEQQAALGGIGMMAWDERFRTKMLDRLPSMNPELRRTVQRNIASSWAMSDPDKAVAWSQTLPADERKELKSTIGNMLVMSDPKRGAEYMLQDATEEEKPQAYAMVVGQWSYRDPKGAGEWLAAQPQGPALDPARSAFARSVAQRDPAAAMDWARSVQDENQRTGAIAQVYQQWRGRDAKAADAALNAAGLSAESAKAIRESPAGPGPGFIRPVPPTPVRANP